MEELRAAFEDLWTDNINEVAEHLCFTPDFILRAIDIYTRKGLWSPRWEED